MDEILKLKPFCSPHRYIFSDPNTHRIFQADSKDLLMFRIRSYRKQNNFAEIEHLPDVLENYWCTLPENTGQCVSVKLKRGFITSIAGGVTLIYKTIMGKFVSQEEADDRASICLKCPHNQFPDKGPYVEWADKVAIEQIGDRTVKARDQLGNCMLCTCPLRSKVFIQGPFKIEPQWEAPMKAVGCWQLKDRK